MQSMYMGSLTSLTFGPGMLQTVGNNFMAVAYFPSLTTLTFADNTLVHVGDDFMNGVQIDPMTSLAFPVGAFQDLGASPF